MDEFEINKQAIARIMEGLKELEGERLKKKVKVSVVSEPEIMKIDKKGNVEEIDPDDAPPELKKLLALDSMKSMKSMEDCSDDEDEESEIDPLDLVSRLKRIAKNKG